MSLRAAAEVLRADLQSAPDASGSPLPRRLRALIMKVRYIPRKAPPCFANDNRHGSDYEQTKYLLALLRIPV